ncbi:hypothetical protein C8N30_1077 [Sulfitobacter guttiformis]|uniref:Uncharacterized protein n=1 Tax=Sulfitobacter guttiformis TaxID=74349 RepID=A0A420DQF7_9RHOB|nr:hypothetical protein C8N30_1077 [Sulfitobacter guttiformis]
MLKSLFSFALEAISIFIQCSRFLVANHSSGLPLPTAERYQALDYENDVPLVVKEKAALERAASFRTVKFNSR